MISTSRGRSSLRDPLDALGLPMVALLAVEFLLGMTLNLFVTLPSGFTVSILESNATLLIHAILALLLVGITARATSLAARTSNRATLGAAVLGLVSSLTATFGGTWFTFGGQSSEASFLMSIGFTGVLVSAVLLLRLPTSAVRTGPPAPRSSPSAFSD